VTTSTKFRLVAVILALLCIANVGFVWVVYSDIQELKAAVYGPVTVPLTKTDVVTVPHTQKVVEYVVTTSAGGIDLVSYEHGNGQNTLDPVGETWTKTFTTGFRSGDIAAVLAVNDRWGSVECSILVNGAVIANSRSSAEYGAVDCMEIIP
jgi:hypothetical protein